MAEQGAARQSESVSAAAFVDSLRYLEATAREQGLTELAWLIGLAAAAAIDLLEQEISSPP